MEGLRDRGSFHGVDVVLSGFLEGQSAVNGQGGWLLGASSVQVASVKTWKCFLAVLTPFLDHDFSPGGTPKP